MRQGKADEAEREFRAELQLDSHYTLAQLGKAETRLLQGHSSAALDTFSKIWDADPPFLAAQSDFPIGELDTRSRGPARQGPRAGRRWLRLASP